MERLTFFGTTLFISCLFAVSVVMSSLPNNYCTPGKTYNTYYPGNCNKYVKCDNGNSTEMECGWFSRFDENSNECQFHWFIFGTVNCTRSNVPVPTTSPVTPPPSGGTKSPNGPTTTPTPKPNSAATTQFSLFLISCALALSYGLLM